MADDRERSTLTRLMLLSVGAGVLTVGLKTVAWALTGSAGLLSDAIESLVNVAAAVVALLVVRWATRPPDVEHMYGHEKAEYFSAGFEGALIILAATAIGWVAVGRLIHPVALEDVGIGLAVSGAAALVNLGVGLTLLRGGRRHRSITLEADGRHLLTDVWTSVGVIAGVAVVAVTGWERLDPLIALAVAINIVFTGWRLVRRAVGGLLDHALPPAEQAALDAALDLYRGEGVEFRSIRDRQAGRRSFVTMDVLVPGDWTVRHGHELADRIEADVRDAVPESSVLTHVEPREAVSRREGRFRGACRGIDCRCGRARDLEAGSEHVGVASRHVQADADGSRGCCERPGHGHAERSRRDDRTHRGRAGRAGREDQSVARVICAA